MSVAGFEEPSAWIAASVLLGLRIAPVFAFAPPFALVRAPVVFRVLLGLGLSILMVSADPGLADSIDLSLAAFVPAAVLELMTGILIVLVFQLAFAALYVAGRTLDIQAGFGLALLIDPTSRSQVPLIGTVFAYAAAAIFFAMNGHHDLLRLIVDSLDAVPLGYASLPATPGVLFEFIFVIFLAGLGVAGAAMLCLFLTDIAIALLTRTLPQMNALILGFQIKTLVLMLVLPMSFGVAAALIARMLVTTLEFLPRLL